jgi:stalled ribosome rescue protein Dom34
MEISTVIKNEEKVTLQINESQTITIESDQLLTIIKEEYELQSIQEFLEQYTPGMMLNISRNTTQIN